LIRLKDGQLDFSNAYAKGIGSWDKVTVKYAYKEFGHNELDSLQLLLNQAFDNGHRYISDADARPSGSAHAYGHLWDNGNDIVQELYNVLDVRDFAISKFSIDNINNNQSYSVLEDVFVPLYYYHRYQTEAVCKIIGGLDYSYAVKGGTSPVVSQIKPEVQKEALKALMQTISVETLMIPKSKLDLFPPRAMGFQRSTESFKSDLGVAFDPFTAAVTASDLTFSLLLHPERVSRLILYQSLDSSQLSLQELLDTLIKNTFKIGHKDHYQRELQNMINEQLLQNIFNLAGEEHKYFQVNVITINKLNELVEYLQSKKSKGEQGLIEDYAIKTISNFIKDPKIDKKYKKLNLPDGSPIGMH
jgi:hypothetical protein